VYTPDTSFILTKLGVRPGSIVLEAGTGSGSFTHALARQVSPSGKVYTFEFNEKRHELNTADFTSHRMDDIVVAQHRDVCALGFSGVDQEADAAFLDLPSPWEAIPHLPSAFTRKRVARVCCFSPCIEQVLSTHTALRKHNFHNIVTYDLQYRNLEARHVSSKSVDEACERLAEIRRRAKGGLGKMPRDERGLKRKPEEGDGIKWGVVGRGDTEVQMHTSFLTFGELMPVIGGIEMVKEEESLAQDTAEE
jgi:tRNA (adenine57-N1/adenine58-N1)-methyltransferase catalytic subunit